MSPRGQIAIALVFVLVVASVPAWVASDFWLSFVIMSLFYAQLGIAWNILGGYGGQYSFGHAAFFGWGAYATAMAQIHLGANPWLMLPVAAAAGGGIGVVLGWLSFRYGLRGSYFALVTLAFAEVFRVLATTFAVTGAGAGLLIALAPGAAQLQFTTKAGFLYLALAFVALGLAASLWLEHSRFGARLAALRENEDAARALGVDVLRVKLGAIALSGALAGLAGAFYAQYFLYLDAGIAFGPAMSVEALLAPIVGGLGTVFGPVIGAFALQLVAEVARHVLGEAPGLALTLFGAILVGMVLFLPRGLMSLARRRRA
ncbi:MAG: branched-chain amino acid ABC transporter permease [Alphaproteobacteria bacterium]|nr:branched-chain amino acid ABC transporter permease [Alphaproteobacteria bacterium]